MQQNPTGGDQPGTGQTRNAPSGAPPILKNFSDAPQYDLATIVQQVGIRAMTLWNWEQQLHVPQPVNSGDVAGAAIRNYSERDLVACSWLRDQVLLGRTPAEAADLLMRAQPAEADAPSGANPRGEPGGGVPRPPVNSRPLAQAPTSWGRPNDRPAVESVGASIGSGALQRGGPTGTPRAAPPSGPLRAPGNTGMLAAPSSGGAMPGSPYGQPRRPPQTAPLSGSGYLVPVPPVLNQPAYPPAVQNFATRPDLSWGQPAQVPMVYAGPNSGALRARPTSNLSWGDPRMSAGGQWPGAPAAVGRELRSLVQPLLRAFVTFDSHLATRLVDEAFSARSAEAVCAGLFIPALARVSELWGRNQMSIPEERFATNFIRARLFSIFATTPEQPEAPLVVVTCGPHEMSDLNALVLAMYWRRAGIRVVFLGQDVDGQALVHDVRMRRPRLVCVSITTPQRVRALARIARGVAQIESPTPIFTYSGSPFARNPELKRKVSGVYLGDDPGTATWHALRLLSVGTRGTPPAVPGHGFGHVG